MLTRHRIHIQYSATLASGILGLGYLEHRMDLRVQYCRNGEPMYPSAIDRSSGFSSPPQIILCPASPDHSPQRALQTETSDVLTPDCMMCRWRPGAACCLLALRRVPCHGTFEERRVRSGVRRRGARTPGYAAGSMRLICTRGAAGPSWPADLGLENSVRCGPTSDRAYRVCGGAAATCISS